MITSDVSTVMRRDPMFLELFQREPEDETQQIFHTSSFENGVRRHVTKLMSSLQYVMFECENITFIIHLLTRTQVLTPSFHGFRSISLLEVTPNVHGLSQETLQSSQQDRIGTSPVRFEGNEEISDQTTHKSEFVEGRGSREIRVLFLPNWKNCTGNTCQHRVRYYRKFDWRDTCCSVKEIVPIRIDGTLS